MVDRELRRRGYESLSRDRAGHKHLFLKAIREEDVEEATVAISDLAKRR
jgi:hypothetical protein